MTQRARPRPKEGRRQKGGGGSPVDNVAGVVVFVVAAAIVAYLFVTNGDLKSREGYWLVNDGLLLWVPLCTILLVLRKELSEFGMQPGESRLGLRVALVAWIVMLIGVAVASRLPKFESYYLTNNLQTDLTGTGPVLFINKVHYPALIYYELAMGFYMFCWEFFFRGFILFGLARTRLGPVMAVIIQAIPFTLLHWSWNADAAKPSLETLGAFPAGIILGMLALRTRSFLYGFLAHWAVSVSMDLFLLAPFIFGRIG